MFFEWIADPAAWAGLGALIVLEIVLGIDNLVFIAILADKLPPHQREKARLIGLSIALIMCLALLASIAWIVTLTQPLFSVLGLGFSGRDLILIFGGLFLLFKGAIERKTVCPLSWGGSSYTASSRVARSGRADPHRRRTSRGAL